MTLARRTFLIHVYDADQSAVVEEVLSSRRARLKDVSGLEDQILIWLKAPPPAVDETGSR